MGSFLEKNIIIPRFLKNKVLILFFLNIIICIVILLFLWQNYSLRKMELLSSKQENLLFNYTALWNSYQLVSESFYKDINISILTDVIKGKGTATQPVLQNTKEIKFALAKEQLMQTDILKKMKDVLTKEKINETAFSKITTKGQYAGGFLISQEFTGFRYIFPLYLQDTYIGKAETSFTFDQLKNEMIKIFPANYNFIVHKNIVEQRIPENQKSEYSTEGITGFYTLYKGITGAETSQNDPVQIPESIIQKINKKIKSITLKNLGEGKPFWLWTDIDEKGYTIIFLPISDIEKQHIGYLVAYYRDYSLQDILKDFESKILATLVLFFLTSIFIYYIYFKDKKLNEAYKTTEGINKLLEKKKEELEDRTEVLEKMNKHMVNRELKMKELKTKLLHFQKKSDNV